MTMRQYGVIVAAAGVSVSALLLGGCGAKSAPDTPYKGSFRAAYTIPDLNQTGTFSFTVEQKGGMTGSLVDQNGTVYAFNGGVAPSGFFSGTAKTAVGSVINQVPISGTLAITGPASGGGDFKETINSQDHRGSFSLTDNTITPTPGSTFRGPYSGLYTVPATGQNGVVSFSVDTHGAITGSLTRGTEKNQETGFLSGSVQESGNFTATVKFANDTQTLTGVLNPTTDGSTSGNFQLTANGAANSGSFGKTTVPTSGDSPLTGSYRGTYGLPENGENGNVSFTVDPRGNIVGFFSQQNNSPVATFTGSFQNDGTFTGTLVYPDNTTRPITGSVAKSALNDGFAGDFVMTVAGKNSPGNFEVSVGASEPDSNYRASYSDAGSFPGDSFIANKPDGTATGLFNDANTNIDAVVEFDVDKEGSVLGVFGTNRVFGRITNDGRFVGFIMGNDGKNYPMQGIMNKLTWTLTVTDPATGKATTAKVPGIKGDFIITVNGQDDPASIKATGGDGITK